MGPDDKLPADPDKPAIVPNRRDRRRTKYRPKVAMPAKWSKEPNWMIYR